MNIGHGCDKSAIGGGNRYGARHRAHRGVGWALPLLMMVLVSSGAHSGPIGPETTKVPLRYDSRDLASPGAVRRLLGRIGDAALEACGASPFSLPEFKIAIRSSQCWRDAVDDAVRRIGNPTLTEYHR